DHSDQYNSQLEALRQQKALACEGRGGYWSGTFCEQGNLDLQRSRGVSGFGGGHGGRRAPIAAPIQNQPIQNQHIQHRGF
ncbi:hypothetical protein N9B72_01090, partial [Bacteriovoracaceae bacterium]|nr:hypothetical protein [Bacteriovoracaceae bacterium]